MYERPACMDVSVPVHQVAEARKDTGPPGAGVKGSYEQSGAGSLSQVL